MIERKLSAYPLFVKDPNFSIWARDEFLPQADTAFWTGKSAKMYGIFEVDGKKYSFMGKSGAQPAAQTDLKITAFSTDYTFTAAGCTLEVRFLSPLPLDDLALLSCPTCFLSYKVTAPAGKKTAVLLFVSDEICYENKANVNFLTIERKGMQNAVVGLERQMPLSNSQDVAAADWGYYYLTAEHAGVTSMPKFQSYVAGGALADAEKDERELLCYARAEGGSFAGKFLLSYDDTVSIYYFGEWLRGYWFRDGKTIFDAIDESLAQYEGIVSKTDAFDRGIVEESRKYGEGYVNLTRAALRQAVAAHKLVQNAKGEVLFLSKECNSNGCIATLDVTYPSVPLFLMYNPVLVKGMMIPIIRFAESDAWNFPFAPHDAGRYPYCAGQVYGEIDDYGKHKILCTVYPNIYLLPPERENYMARKHMPVEECGNALIVMDVLLRHGEEAFVREHFKLLKCWADYLVQKGVVPENQLCTDDFAGMLDKNVNLAIKSTVGVRAFADICERLQLDDGARYRKVADAYVREILALERDGITPLTFDHTKSAFSLKYNLYFDKLLGFKLFPAELYVREVDYYLAHADRYGVRLDDRSTISKTDWLIWTASLTDDVKKSEKFVEMVGRFLTETQQREPFPDYYDVVSGESKKFRNRTVQGAMFALLYRDRSLTKSL